MSVYPLSLDWFVGWAVVIPLFKVPTDIEPLSCSRIVGNSSYSKENKEISSWDNISKLQNSVFTYES